MVNLGWNASTAVAVNGTAMGFHSAMPKSATSSVSASTLEDGGINGGDFEEIGLDDTPGELSEKHRVPPTAVRSISLGNGIRRPATIDHATVIPNGRELTQASQKRAGLPSISTNVPTPPSSIKESRLNLPAGGGRYPSPNRTISRSPSRKSTTSVNCPPSPATSTASQNSPPLSFKQRSSWQGARKKTIEEIEAECDDSDDEIPDDAVFWNVPISPRLGRSTSSLSASPERYRNMLRSDAPGTKPRPQIRGNSTGVITNKETRGRSQGRAKSWNDAIQELGDEARELSEALERHADEELEETSRRLHEKIPKPQKPAVRPHTITLPPLQVTNGLIDPLPISKEKEAVLSRTRPSWLPPKSKKEEEKHLREYKRMMEAAQEAEKRRQEKERKEQEIRDKIQNDLHQLWDCEILPNWAKKIKEPNTRELWWRGVAPRCRGIVWAKAIGNSLHITAETYKRALKRAKELEQRLAESTTLQDSRERKMYESIRKDVTRAFPELKIFQEGAPLHDPLVDVLFAYSTYRSDIGYVHGIHVRNLIVLTYFEQAMLINMPDDCRNSSLESFRGGDVYCPSQHSQPTDSACIPHKRHNYHLKNVL